MNFEDKITIGLNSIFASISIVDFKNFLDMILIIISIINILFVIVCKIIRAMKDKKFDDKEKADILNDFDTLKDLYKEGEEIGKGQNRTNNRE